MKKAIIVLAVILIPFILLITNLRLVAFNESFHKKEFVKYDVYSKLPGEEIEKINSEVISYLKTGKGNLEFFNEKEKSHLEDVRKLMKTFFIIDYSLIALFFILLINLHFIDKKNLLKDIGKILLYGGLITLAAILVFLLMVKLDFMGFFTGFHELLFKPDTWWFDELTDKITTLYPMEFFYDAIIEVFLGTVVSAFILAVTGFILRYGRFKLSKIRLLR